MKLGHKIRKKIKAHVMEPLENNAYILSAKSTYNLIFRRNSDYFTYKYPLLVVSGLQRSGTHLVENVLKNHPKLMCYYKELQIGKPNKYYWPVLQDIDNAKKRFEALIPQNMRKHFLNFRGHENFIFDFSYFRKIFLELEKENIELNQRKTLNNYFTAYFNAYLNYIHSNFYDEYKYIVTTIPGLAIRRESIKNFFNDYPDGKMIISFRDPCLWWNSAQKHTKRLNKHGLQRLNKTLDNIKWACEEYKEKICPISFDHLIKDTDRSIVSIFEHLKIEKNNATAFPSNFPYYANDNSTFGHKKTKEILKDKIKREVEISDKDKKIIDEDIYPIYREVLAKYTVNSL